MSNMEGQEKVRFKFFSTETGNYNIFFFFLFLEAWLNWFCWRWCNTKIKSAVSLILRFIYQQHPLSNSIYLRRCTVKYPTIILYCQRSYWCVLIAAKSFPFYLRTFFSQLVLKHLINTSMFGYTETLFLPEKKKQDESGLISFCRKLSIKLLYVISD